MNWIQTDHKYGDHRLESIELLVPYSEDHILCHIATDAVIVGMSGCVVFGPNGFTQYQPKLSEWVAHEDHPLIHSVSTGLVHQILVEDLPEGTVTWLGVPGIGLRYGLISDSIVMICIFGHMLYSNNVWL